MVTCSVVVDSVEVARTQSRSRIMKFEIEDPWIAGWEKKGRKKQQKRNGSQFLKNIHISYISRVIGCNINRL